MKPILPLPAAGWRWSFLLGVVPFLGACGCSSMTHTETGALAGGAAEEKAKDPAVAAIQAQQQQQQLAVGDIVRMVQDHISDAVIIQHIRTSPVVYHLTAADIEFLKGNGVCDAVILEMQATANRPGCVSVPAPADSVYVVRPAPPPVAVGFRFGYWR